MMVSSHVNAFRITGPLDEGQVMRSYMYGVPEEAVEPTVEILMM